MILCPIAIVAGCSACPAYRFCPLKSVFGDHVAESQAPDRSGTGDPPKAASKET